MGLKLSRVDTKTIRFLEGSKLKDKEVTFRGLNQMSYFTVQCWALQLLYFIGSAACYVLSLRAAPISSVLLKRVLPAACWCATATRTDAPTHQPLRVPPGSVHHDRVQGHRAPRDRVPRRVSTPPPLWAAAGLRSRSPSASPSSSALSLPTC